MFAKAQDKLIEMLGAREGDTVVVTVRVFRRQVLRAEFVVEQS
ncbi:MAG TPA: hypothetical protein VK631_17060 [Solirubrobacteraceae bacterium]|nr:hypothetical protein [Solirubrobacteraceae bacterium]